MGAGGESVSTIIIAYIAIFFVMLMFALAEPNKYDKISKVTILITLFLAPISWQFDLYHNVTAQILLGTYFLIAITILYYCRKKKK